MLLLEVPKEEVGFVVMLLICGMKKPMLVILKCGEIAYEKVTFHKRRRELEKLCWQDKE